MRYLIAIAGVIALALVAFAPRGGFAQSAPSLLTAFTVTNGTGESKYPGIVRINTNDLLMVTNRRLDGKNTEPIAYTKSELAGAFTGPAVIGALDATQPVFVGAAVASDANGQNAYAAWSRARNAIFFSQRNPADGTWSAARQIAIAPVAGADRFPVETQIGVASDGQVFVVWREGSVRQMYYTRSVDGGATWTPAALLSSRTSDQRSIASIAVGPSGQLAVAYQTRSNTNQIQVYIGVWNGSTFVERQATPDGALQFADPGIDYGLDGRIYMSLREINGGGGYYAIENASGGFDLQRLTSAEPRGSTTLIVDSAGNRHITWMQSAGSGFQTFYAFQPVEAVGFNGIVTPTTFDSGGELRFNGRGTVTVSADTQILFHVVGEIFTGSLQPQVRYHLFASGRTAVPPATATPTPSPTPQIVVEGAPVVANGDEIIGKQASVTLSFSGLSGNPDQVRWRWNAPPDDQNSDSGGYVAIPSSIVIPAGAIDPNSCRPAVLYTQLRNSAANVPQTQAASDSVVVDNRVDAQVQIANPFSRAVQPIFTPNLSDFAQSGGASDGHIGYTREPIFYLEINGRPDCKGLYDASYRGLNGSQPLIQLKKTPRDDVYRNIVPMPGTVISGTNHFTVTITDDFPEATLNRASYSASLIYDPIAPTLITGTLSATSDPRASLLVDLSFSGVEASDNLYPAPRFWGVWIANSRTPVTDFANSALFWSPLAVNGVSQGNFTIEDWSLATGFTSEIGTAGSYYIYARLLDGAGNPSSAVLSAQITLSAPATLPRLYMPLVRR